MHILYFNGTWISPMMQPRLFLISNSRLYFFPCWTWISGVGFLESNTFEVTSHSVIAYSSFETNCIEISDFSFTGYFLCRYRPIRIRLSFCIDYHGLSENVVNILPNCFILCDFNLHFDKQSTITSICFMIIFTLTSHKQVCA